MRNTKKLVQHTKIKKSSSSDDILGDKGDNIANNNMYKSINMYKDMKYYYIDDILYKESASVIIISIQCW